MSTPVTAMPAAAKPPRDAAVTAGRVEDLRSVRQVEQAEDLGGVGIGVGVVDGLLVEVEVVVTEGALQIEMHAPSSPLGSAQMPAPGRHRIRHRHGREPARATPLSSIPTSTRCGPSATSPTAGTSSPSWVGPPAWSACGDGGPAWETVSASITYAAPPNLVAATVRTTVLRRGRTAAQVRAVLVQEGRDLVDALFVLATVPPAHPRYDGIGPLTVPPPEACERLGTEIPGGMRVGLMDGDRPPARSAHQSIQWQRSRRCPGRATRLDSP